MKNKLNLFGAATFLALFAISGFAQTLMTVATEEDLDADPVQNIIKESVRVVNGKSYPIVVPTGGENQHSTQSVCAIGDTRNVNAAIDANAESEGKLFNVGKITYEETTPYSPPLQNWVISSYTLQDLSMAGASRILTAVPANYNFVASNQFHEIYTETKGLIAKANILDKYKIDLDLQIKQFRDNYSGYTSSVSSSHGSARLYIRLTNRGKSKGRSWYKGKVNTTELCTPIEIRDPQAFRTMMTNWTKNAIDKLPKRPRPVGSEKVEVLELKDQ